jgi:Tfp pilus assembly PilM family ATPase
MRVGDGGLLKDKPRMVKPAPSKGQSRKTPTDMAGVDFATSGTKVVRLRKSNGKFILVAADILPPLLFNGAGPAAENPLKSFHEIPKAFRTNYVALAASSPQSIVRLLNLPGNIQASEAIEAHLRDHAGLEGPYRLSYTAAQTVSSTRGKPEMKFLAVAMPESEAQSLLKVIPTAGPPAPWSLEVAGLGALTAFMHGPGAKHAQDAVGLVEAGARVALLALLHKGALVLVRKFDFGFETLISKVEQQMGVDREVARGIISDGSFDISSCVVDVMGPFLRQLSISRDFVERQEKCRISQLYLSGGMSLSRYWADEIASGAKLDVALWNPFEGVHVPAGAYPDAYRGQQTRFTAALGAAMGGLEG